MVGTSFAQNLNILVKLYAFYGILIKKPTNVLRFGLNRPHFKQVISAFNGNILQEVVGY
ncbi:MAG: hypothetical protein QT04_C0001G0004 [archaeon GW2011_AR11]|nr:MAG: hypothetical protein QT04_C0001G0004 [archaeon GW2011_AR11]